MTEGPVGGAGRKPDWAEREAARIQNMPHFTKERQLAEFVRAPRRAEKRGYQRGERDMAALAMFMRLGARGGIGAMDEA